LRAIKLFWTSPETAAKFPVQLALGTRSSVVQEFYYDRNMPQTLRPPADCPVLADMVLRKTLSLPGVS
jgi:hypothetical protein